MGKKQPTVYNKWLAIILDIFGIILTLVGATLTRSHPAQLFGYIIFWVGLALLILALMLFVIDLSKKQDLPPVDRTKIVDKDF